MNKTNRKNRIILQVALDFVDLKRAIVLAREALKGGADWLEAGTPLIKSEGIDSVRELRKTFPSKTIIADMKIVDAGRAEVETAAKAGANIVTVISSAACSTIRECVEAASNYGAKIMVDFIDSEPEYKKVKEMEKMGVDYIGIHTAIDEQMKGRISFNKVEELSKMTKLPLAAAGGINSANAKDAVNAGACIIVVGGAVTKAKDAAKAVREIRRAVEGNISIKTELFARSDSMEDIKKMLVKVSTANVSDALHRQKALEGMLKITAGVKLIGPAYTVRTYPGDWAKPVEAIDEAPRGAVIVVDAGGTGPAVWGELATSSAINRGIAGVVIEGAIRDVEEIRAMKFPAYARQIMSAAGEPKGLGEMNVAVNAGGFRIFPGDMIFGDEDGVIVIGKDKIFEAVNRAMDVLERENRIKKEISGGSSLGKVTELLKWEKMKEGTIK